MDSDMLDMLDGDTATAPETTQDNTPQTKTAEIPQIETMPDISEILEAEEEEFLRERKKEPETADIPELEPAPEPETADIPELEPQAVGEVRDILETCIILMLAGVSMKYEISERLTFVENFTQKNKKQIDKIIKKVERVLRQKHTKLYNKLSKSNDYTFMIDVVVLVLTFDECLQEHIRKEPAPETADIPELEPAPETADIPELEPQAVGEVRDILETCIILMLAGVSMKYEISERLTFVENFTQKNKKQIDKIIKKVERVLRQKHTKLYNKLSKSNDYTFMIDVVVLVLTFDECLQEHIRKEPAPETADIPELEPAPETADIPEKRKRFLK